VTAKDLPVSPVAPSRSPQRPDDPEPGTLCWRTRLRYLGIAGSIDRRVLALLVVAGRDRRRHVTAPYARRRVAFAGLAPVQERLEVRSRDSHPPADVNRREVPAVDPLCGLRGNVKWRGRT
jgi:hypothetical protein